MNQSTVLDWLGIDVWRPRVVPPLFSALVESSGQTTTSARTSLDALASLEPSVSPSEVIATDPFEAAPTVHRAHEEAPSVDGTAVSEGRECADTEISARVVLLHVHDRDTPPVLFARISRSLPRGLLVRHVRVDAADAPSIHWQGIDWRLSDLRRDSGLKRRLWRALCLPGQQVE